MHSQLYGCVREYPLHDGHVEDKTGKACSPVWDRLLSWPLDVHLIWDAHFRYPAPQTGHYLGGNQWQTQGSLDLGFLASWTEKWTSLAMQIKETPGSCPETLRSHLYLVSPPTACFLLAPHPTMWELGLLGLPSSLRHIALLFFPAYLWRPFKKSFCYGNAQIYSKVERLDECTHVYQSLASTSIKPWISLLHPHAVSPSTHTHALDYFKAEIRHLTILFVSSEACMSKML